MPIHSDLLEKLKAGEYDDETLDLSYQHLNLDDMQLLADALRKNISIQTLIISGNQVGDDGIRLLISNKLSFTTLIAIDCRITVIHFSATQTNINRLDLANNEVSAEGILELSKSSVQWLNLAGNDLDDESCHPIGKMPAIKTLTLSHNRIGLKTCQNLSASTTLEILNLHNNKLKIEKLDGILTSRTIKSLGMGGNVINAVVLHAISINHHLTSLNLSNCNLTDEQALLLAAHPTLTHLNLGYNKLTPEVASAFLSARLTSLNLCYNQIGDTGALTLAQHPTLTHLDLTGNGLTYEGGIGFMDNNILRVLNLNSNRIGAAIVGLANNATLKELSIADNQINDDALVFRFNKTLDVLNLSSNNLGNTTIKMLQQHCSIKKLIMMTRQPRELFTDNMYRIFHFTDSPVYIIDGDSREFLLCSSPYSRTFGFTLNDLQGKLITQFMHPDDIEPEKKIIAEDKPTYTYENRFQCKDGSYRNIRWTTWFHNGLMFGIGEDQTDLKHAQKQAMIAERNKEDIARYATFISYLSHEIRNPCSGIVSLSDFSLQVIERMFGSINKLSLQVENTLTVPGSPADEIIELKAMVSEVKEYLDDIRSCATIQQEVLDRNLEISRIREGKLKLQKKPFEILASLNNITKVFKNRARAMQLELNVTNQYNTAFWVIGDAIELEQIIINIVSNALKFTKQGGIYIEANITNRNEKETDFVIKVRDTGIGMNEEECNRLFQRFSQATATTGHEYGGSGLGLHIAQQKALLMNGDITVASEKGLGTTFSILLKLPTCAPEQIPLDEKLQASSMRNSTSRTTLFFPAPTTPLGNVNILVAEDNSVNQKIMRQKLSKLHYKFLIVSNGQEAFDAYTKQPDAYDVILMDIQMPILTGVEATLKIRKFETDNEILRIPIIALTANAMEQDQRNGTLAGMDAYLTKPCNDAELKNAIHALCSKSRADKAAEEKPAGVARIA